MTDTIDTPTTSQSGTRELTSLFLTWAGGLIGLVVARAIFPSNAPNGDASLAAPFFWMVGVALGVGIAVGLTRGLNIGRGLMFSWLVGPLAGALWIAVWLGGEPLTFLLSAAFIYWMAAVAVPILGTVGDLVRKAASR